MCCGWKWGKLCKFINYDSHSHNYAISSIISVISRSLYILNHNYPLYVQDLKYFCTIVVTAEWSMSSTHNIFQPLPVIMCWPYVHDVDASRVSLPVIINHNKTWHMTKNRDYDSSRPCLWWRRSWLWWPGHKSPHCGKYNGVLHYIISNILNGKIGNSTVLNG